LPPTPRTIKNSATSILVITVSYAKAETVGIDLHQGDASVSGCATIAVRGDDIPAA
jgi:hypothetical protein